jgi:hypothetical protein
MLVYFPATVLAATLFLPAMPGLASDTTGQPGRGGDGHCPIPELATDPDCAREGVQWRGTGREQASSRERFPECMNGVCRRRADLVATSEADKRNQWPERVPQPGHLG